MICEVCRAGCDGLAGLGVTLLLTLRSSIWSASHCDIRVDGEVVRAVARYSRCILADISGAIRPLLLAQFILMVIRQSRSSILK